MIRTLDLNTLRSFVMIADCGGMTQAANRLHMTQSTISMQIKRLEAQLGTRVLDRTNRKIRPNLQGDQLLSYARRMLELNDEAWGRLTAPQYEGSVSIGVPGDIVHPHLPNVLRTFKRDFPRSSVRLTTDFSIRLKQAMLEGKQDLVLTTETAPTRDGETLCTLPLIWMGAHQGHACSVRPLPLSFTQGCVFRNSAIRALDANGVNWVDAIDSFDCDSTMVFAAADLAITADLGTHRATALKPVPEEAGLPELPSCSVMMYLSEPASEVASALAEYLRLAYGAAPAELV